MVNLRMSILEVHNEMMILVELKVPYYCPCMAHYHACDSTEQVMQAEVIIMVDHWQFTNQLEGLLPISLHLEKVECNCGSHLHC